MKLFNRYIAFALCSAPLALTSCADLDTEPAGSSLTETQVKKVVSQDPAKLKSQVSGLYANFIQYGAIAEWYGSVRHYDFGLPAAMIMNDASGMDQVSENTGYNWFRGELRYSDRTVTSDVTYFLWNLYYKNIKASNDVLASVDLNTTDATALGYMGQAYAMRAFCYLQLVQAYQFTYKGHEDAPAVPILTETTTGEQAANNPRAAVKDVYALILADLDKAIKALEGYNRGGKEEIDQSVAYGLRARANLVMQNWDAAYSDAVAAANGYSPLSLAKAAAPGFNDANAGNWMWGCVLTEDNEVVQSGILNFPSMMCSFTGNGYSPMYASRRINSNLWAQIPSTDVRKGWWIDEDLQSPIVDKKRAVTVDDGKNYYVAVFNASGEEVINWTKPYLNVKFGAYKNDYGNETNACDIPIMRVEEMLLIQAEAKAMAGDLATAKTILEGFVKANRDPEFASKATSAGEFQDEVWMQRRVELWGEGFSLQDVLRLKKAVDRTDSNFENTVAYKLEPESQILLWIIPEDEENYNEAIKGKNNPVVEPPTAQ